MKAKLLKHKLFTFVTVGAVAALGAGTASAAQSTSDRYGTNEQNGAAGQPNRAWTKAQAQEFFRASDLTGKNVQDSANQKIGEIKNIVFNQEGNVFALVDVGRNRLAVVPWQAFSPPSAKGKQNLVINTTAKEVEAGPVVTETQWGALNNPTFVDGVYSYYHVKPAMEQGGATSPGGTEQGKESSKEKPDK
jgi:sporulation protein YlmC with PRC-barrel domain